MVPSRAATHPIKVTYDSKSVFVRPLSDRNRACANPLTRHIMGFLVF